MFAESTSSNEVTSPTTADWVYLGLLGVLSATFAAQLVSSAAIIVGKLEWALQSTLMF